MLGILMLLTALSSSSAGMTLPGPYCDGDANECIAAIHLPTLWYGSACCATFWTPPDPPYFPVPLNYGDFASEDELLDKRLSDAYIDACHVGAGPGCSVVYDHADPWSVPVHNVNGYQDPATRGRYWHFYCYHTIYATTDCDAWEEFQVDPWMCPVGYSFDYDYVSAGAYCYRPKIKNCGPICPQRGDPIDVMYKEVRVEETDWSIGLLSVAHTYRSRGFHDPLGAGTIPHPLGYWWRGNYEQYIVEADSTLGHLARMSRPTGDVYDFVQSVSGYHGDADSPGKLTQLLDAGVPSGWQYEDAGKVETYDVGGLLIGISVRDGNSITIEHDGSGNVSNVTDSKGRRLHYTYNVAGQLISVTLPDGGDIVYHYDDTNYPNLFLSGVTYPGGATRSYRYEFPNYSGPLLTSIIDENGKPISSYTYNSNGYPLSSTQPGGANSISIGSGYSYTDALGATHTFTVQGTGGAQRITGETVTCSGCATIFQSVQYDTIGTVHSVTDFNGNKTIYSYEAVSFLETSRTEASNDAQSKRTIERDWHTTLQLPIEQRTKDASGTIEAKTRWMYNTRGQISARCDVDVSVVGADAYVCGSSIDAPVGVRQWRYGYCEPSDVAIEACPIVGLLTSTNGPRSSSDTGMAGVDDATTFEYYQADDPACATSHTCVHRHGDLWKETNALGQVKEYVSYDLDGRVSRVKDSNGTYTDFSYNSRGWLTDHVVRDSVSGAPSTKDAVVHLDYDPAGNINQVTQPDGDYLRYTYDDAHRLIMIGDNLGNSIDYCPGGVGSAECLDPLGNRKVERVTDASMAVRRSMHRQYDMLGHLEEALNASGQTTFDATGGYDPNGNIVSSVDGLGYQTQRAYDGLNRLIKTLQNYSGADTATQNTETDYGYDTLNNLRSVSDPDGLVTNYTYDGLDDLTDLNSPDTGHTSYSYDKAGNRISQTDNRLVTTTYTYDALNRLKSISYPTSTLSVAYAYDQDNLVTGCTTSYPIGRLTQMSDGTGSTIYCYDRRGNVVKKIQTTAGTTLATQMGYSMGDRLASVTYPSGITIGYIHDAIGRITQVNASGAVSAAIVTNATYYPFGPLNTLTFGNGRILTKTYDQNYAIDKITSSGLGGLTLDFNVDVMGNITNVSQTIAPPTPDRTYGYDPLYRLTTVQAGANHLEDYTYNRTGDRLTAAFSGGSPLTYTYASGTHHLASVGGASRSYDLNGNTQTGIGTLTLGYDDKNRLATAGSYTYETNGRGERVRKSSILGSPTLFNYDEGGQLLGEYSGVGTAQMEYIYLDNLPIAVVKNGAISYIETDQLGTPRQVISPSTNGIMWKWDLLASAFGTNAPVAPSITLDLRLPGQYSDVETGLNYNYFRDYDGLTGRYIESDAIGLGGGFSTYQYAFSRPITYVDRNGEMALALAVGTSCLSGCLGDVFTNYGKCALPKLASGESFGKCNDDCKPTPCKFANQCAQGCIIGSIIGGVSSVVLGASMKATYGAIGGTVGSGAASSFLKHIWKPDLCSLLYELGPTGHGPPAE
jgi:RHS repeat-associated protein